jgi:hypothetical protein
MKPRFIYFLFVPVGVKLSLSLYKEHRLRVLRIIFGPRIEGATRVYYITTSVITCTLPLILLGHTDQEG